MVDSDLSNPGTDLTRKRPDRPRRGGLPLGHVQADIVKLHDDRDDTVNSGGDRDGDQAERRRLQTDRQFPQLVERDRHDLRRQDEVGPDRARHLSLLEFLRRIDFGQHFEFVMLPQNDFEDLLGRLERQIGAADHQQGSHRPWREAGEQHRHWQQDQQFVAQRA